MVLVDYLKLLDLSIYPESIDRLEDRRGSPERFKSVGTEGPNISVSSMPLRRPERA